MVKLTRVNTGDDNIDDDNNNTYDGKIRDKISDIRMILEDWEIW